MWVGVGVSEEGAGAAYLCPPDRGPEEGQQRVIWVSRESGGRGVDSGGPPGLSLQSRNGGSLKDLFRSPGHKSKVREAFSSPRGLSGARLPQRGPPVRGVGDRAGRPEVRGAAAPSAGRVGTARRPPAPLPTIPQDPRRHSLRSGPRAAGRAALGLRQARSGPGSGGGRAIVRCIVGAARAGARVVEGAVPRALYGPARPRARAAQPARGRRAESVGSGAATRASAFPLPASQPRRSGAPPPTWAPPRGHRHTCCCGRLSYFCCCCRCRSGGGRRTPGTWPVTCSTVPAWVRPPEPTAQMEKLRLGRRSHFCEAPTDASRLVRSRRDLLERDKVCSSLPWLHGCKRATSIQLAIRRTGEAK